jgi:hypothetical protein
MYIHVDFVQVWQTRRRSLSSSQMFGGCGQRVFRHSTSGTCSTAGSGKPPQLARSLPLLTLSSSAHVSLAARRPRCAPPRACRSDSDCSPPTACPRQTLKQMIRSERMSCRAKSPGQGGQRVCGPAGPHLSLPSNPRYLLQTASRMRSTTRANWLAISVCTLLSKRSTQQTQFSLPFGRSSTGVGSRLVPSPVDEESECAALPA